MKESRATHLSLEAARNNALHCWVFSRVKIVSSWQAFAAGPRMSASLSELVLQRLWVSVAALGESVAVHQSPSTGLERLHLTVEKLFLQGMGHVLRSLGPSEAQLS